MAPKPQPDPIYFLDENMEALDVASRLHAAGLRCVRFSDAGDEFYDGMPDTEWIPRVAARGWWGVTRDGRTLTNTAERAAIAAARAVHIYLRGQNLRIDEMANALIVAHQNRRMAARIEARTRPVIVVLQPDGSFKLEGGERRAAIDRG